MTEEEKQALLDLLYDFVYLVEYSQNISKENKDEAHYHWSKLADLFSKSGNK